MDLGNGIVDLANLLGGSHLEQEQPEPSAVASMTPGSIGPPKKVKQDKPGSHSVYSFAE